VTRWEGGHGETVGRRVWTACIAPSAEPCLLPYTSFWLAHIRVHNHGSVMQTALLPVTAHFACTSVTSHSGYTKNPVI